MQKKNKVHVWIRFLVGACGLALTAVLFVPIWRIDLAAPQYPEGLRMLIYANKLGGNVDIINGLNHYIGMKTLHAEDFIEFTVLQYIIGVFAALFIIVGALGNRKLLYALLALFFAFGVLAMVDFWRWEYNYGHNLDPHAAIVVPGMAYQPPLIGYKQLLNFAAFSVPDIGGWIFVAVGLLLLFSVLMDIFKYRKVKLHKHTSVLLFGILTAILFTSCDAQPRALQPGKDNCDYCKMTVTDMRFGAELLTKKGRIYVFDDLHCLAAFMKENKIAAGEIKDTYLSDYSGSHELVPTGMVHLFHSDGLHSPMGGNVAAFKSIDSLDALMKGLEGERVLWDDFKK